MEILNPGNVLPIYARLESQMRYRCGCEHTPWAISVAQGESLPFQLPVSVGLSTWNVRIFTDTDIPYASLSSFLNYRQTGDGARAWVTYTGGLSALNSLPCGKYYLEFKTPDGRVTRYSEMFRVMNMTGRKKAYKVTFTHSTDIDGLLYQTGYTQKFWVTDAVFDTPQVVEPVTNVTDGNAVEVPVFQSVQRRDVLRFPNFPDFWQGTLQRLRMHDTISLFKMETGEVWTLGGRSLSVATDEQDICFSLGIMSWIASTQVTSSCNENYILAV